ncbi:MAG: hypothetical protein ACRD02_07155 [Acidimicrobiia bacterium]
MEAVRDHGRPRVDDPSRLEGVEALGLDEHRFLSATPTTPTTWVTGFVDLEEAQLLEVALGNSAATVREWLEERPPDSTLAASWRNPWWEGARQTRLWRPLGVTPGGRERA